MRFLLPLAMASTFIASSLPVQATPNTNKAGDLGGGMAVSDRSSADPALAPESPLVIASPQAAGVQPGRAGSNGMALFSLSDKGIDVLPSLSRVASLRASPAAVPGNAEPGLISQSATNPEVVIVPSGNEPFTVNFAAPLGPLRGVVLVRRQEEGNPIVERLDVADTARVTFSADRRSITLRHSQRVEQGQVYRVDFGSVSGLSAPNVSPLLFSRSAANFCPPGFVPRTGDNALISPQGTNPDLVTVANGSEPFTISFADPVGPLRGVVLIQRQGDGNPIVERLDAADSSRVAVSADRRSITLRHSLNVEPEQVYRVDFSGVSGLSSANVSPLLFTRSAVIPCVAAAAVSAGAIGGSAILWILVAAGLGVGIAAAAGAFSSGGGGGGGGTNPSSK